jgi:hypothetical protein
MFPSVFPVQVTFCVVTILSFPGHWGLRRLGNPVRCGHMSGLFVRLCRWPSWGFATCRAPINLACSRHTDINGLARTVFTQSPITPLQQPPAGLVRRPCAAYPPFHTGMSHRGSRLRLCRTARRTVDLVVRHQRPDDARRLVRQCDGRQSGWATLENAPEPCTSNCSIAPRL